MKKFAYLWACGLMALAACTSGTTSNQETAGACDGNCKHGEQQACSGNCQRENHAGCQGNCKEKGGFAYEDQGHAACPDDCADQKSTMMVQLNIVRKMKPGNAAAFIASFQKCKESTVKEPGCIDYSIYQSVEDSTVLFIAETWKNEGELAKHGETEHLKIHAAETKGMADPEGKGSFQKIYICPKVNQK
ncbi:MAG: putative quinol monooxygenase [Parabacteroides sp.]